MFLVDERRGFFICVQVPANPETWDRNPFELSREGTAFIILI
jgi:hypothetical protein